MGCFSCIKTFAEVRFRRVSTMKYFGLVILLSFAIFALVQSQSKPKSQWKECWKTDTKGTNTTVRAEKVWDDDGTCSLYFTRTTCKKDGTCVGVGRRRKRQASFGNDCSQPLECYA